MKLVHLFAVAVATLSICGCSSVTNVAAAGSDAAAESSATCNAAGDAGETVAATPTFVRSRAVIAPARDHHATFIAETSAGAFLYVLGGGQDDFKTMYKDIQRAKLNDDGSLDTLAPFAELPEARAGAAFVFAKKTVYLFGGLVGARGRLSDTTIFSKIADDGSFGPWTAGPNLETSVMHAATAVVGDWLYVFGGTTGFAASAMSLRAKMQPDGSLSPFEAVTKLSPPRSHQAAFARGSWVYLVGGLTAAPQGSPPSRKDVMRAEVQCDGTLGDWNPAGDLPLPLSVSAAQAYEGAVYMLGGLSDNATTPFTDNVLRASFGADGSLSAVENLPAKLSTQRGHVHQTPIWKNHIYSVGGRGNDNAAIGIVDVGTFQ
jgi:hypothetical protein